MRSSVIDSRHPVSSGQAVRDGMLSRAIEVFRRYRCVLLELATGFGKTRMATALINEVRGHVKDARVLILVAKRVHKGEWLREFSKWGGVEAGDVTIECYESLRKHAGERFDLVVCDECFRGDVEILTDKGYKRFDVLDGSESVAQFTENGEIKFVKPLGFIKREHHGEMVSMHLGRGRHVHLTPGHEQVYRTSHVDGWRKRPVRDLSRGNHVKIPVSGKGTGDNKPLTNLERVLIAIQADGTLQRHQIHESAYSIQLTKERKCERFKSLIGGLDIHEIAHKKAAKVRYMCKLPKGDAKLLSTHFSVDMGYDRACQFIDEVVEWDGYRYSDDCVYYSSVMKENADFVSAIAVQAGYKVLQGVERDERKSSYRDVHRVYMRKRRDTDTQPMRKESYDYDGFVYCVEVPSHMIVVRSDGYSFISGNCHHLSEARREALSTMDAGKVVGLSATLPNVLKDWFRERYDTVTLSMGLPSAIRADVLPEPVIWLLGMDFPDGGESSETIVRNGGKGLPVVECRWEDRWSWMRRKDVEVRVRCSPRQYLDDLESRIAWFRDKVMDGEEWARNRWLRLCKDRLEWLACLKDPALRELLYRFDGVRTMTFCASVAQAESLGEHCVHSGNGLSQSILDAFNRGDVNHVTAVNILNEGVNVVDCKVGILANVNASDIIVRQRIGRLLRHESPVLVIPYWKGTREEELVKRHVEGYDERLVRRAASVDDIKL